VLASGLPRRGEEEGPAPDARRGEKGGVAAGVGRVAANALAWPSTHISMGRAEREPGAALSAGRKGGPAPGGRRGERGEPAAGAVTRWRTKREDDIGLRVDFAKI